MVFLLLRIIDSLSEMARQVTALFHFVYHKSMKNGIARYKQSKTIWTVKAGSSVIARSTFFLYSTLIVVYSNSFKFIARNAGDYQDVELPTAKQYFFHFYW